MKLEPPVDFVAMRSALQELPGIGPWTAEYVAMRALEIVTVLSFKRVDAALN